jgi:flagellar hook assembly protein FlgD
VYIGSEPQNPGAPAITTLKGIYPNPFNPSTTISYSLAKSGEVNIRIFNSRGQLVRNYQQGLQNAGNYNLIWNGQDDNGQNMSSGVYFFRMQAGDKVFSSKAVLLK